MQRHHPRGQRGHKGQGSRGDEAGSLDGLHIPGGCLDCDAYQTVDSTRAPLYFLTVHHDETCPAYRAMEKDS
jgi:hypothetical protein